MRYHALPFSALPSSMGLPASHSATPPRPWWRQLFLVVCAIAGLGYAILDAKAQLDIPMILGSATVMGRTQTYHRLLSAFPLDRHIRFIAEAYRRVPPAKPKQAR